MRRLIKFFLWFIFLALIIGIILFFFIIPRYKTVMFTPKNDNILVFNDQVITLEEPIINKDSIIYIPIALANAYIGDDFFYDPEEEVFTYTDYDQVIRAGVNDQKMTINGEPHELDHPFIEKKGNLYIPWTFILQHYELKIDFDPLYNRYMMDTMEKSLVYGEVLKKYGRLYEEPTTKSSPITTLVYGEKMRLFEYEEQTEWLKVRTEAGLVGFVKSKNVGNVNKEINITVDDSNKDAQEGTDQAPKLSMVWHQVFNQTANGKVKETFKNVEGLHIISPTWLSLKNQKGDVGNIANRAYVNWAHQQGYEIWALFDNAFNGELTHAVLTSTEKRQYVIDQLMDLAKQFNLDGINIDFESVPKETGIYYVQFMKELAPQLRARGLRTTVDVYVPSGWTNHYRRDILGQVTDYVIIMGYDEHWSGSENSGSVSSIGFVESAIMNTLEEVPREKVILGVPFYTRLWIEQEVDGQIELSSKAMGMTAAYQLLEKNGAEITWLEEVGQYYGQYERDNITYKIWLEDERSLEEKLKMAMQYDIAGISAWKKGLEKDEVWPLIHESLQLNIEK